MNSGTSSFFTPPSIYHGPNGIIVGHDTIVGKKSVICQQVTISHGCFVIGDNVFIGAGAKIIPNVKIGNNVKIALMQLCLMMYQIMLQ